jgi:hypothetical protein
MPADSGCTPEHWPRQLGHVRTTQLASGRLSRRPRPGSNRDKRRSAVAGLRNLRAFVRRSWPMFERTRTGLREMPSNAVWLMTRVLKPAEALENVATGARDRDRPDGARSCIPTNLPNWYGIRCARRTEPGAGVEICLIARPDTSVLSDPGRPRSTTPVPSASSSRRRPGSRRRSSPGGRCDRPRRSPARSRPAPA